MINGAVLARSFDDTNDDVAVDILAAASPGREIVTADARPLFDRGGGFQPDQTAAHSIDGTPADR